MRLDISSRMGVLTLVVEVCAGWERRVGHSWVPSTLEVTLQETVMKSHVMLDPRTLESRIHDMDILYLNHDARMLTMAALMKLGPF